MPAVKRYSISTAEINRRNYSQRAAKIAAARGSSGGSGHPLSPEEEYSIRKRLYTEELELYSTRKRFYTIAVAVAILVLIVSIVYIIYFVVRQNNAPLTISTVSPDYSFAYAAGISAFISVCVIGGGLFELISNWSRLYADDATRIVELKQNIVDNDKAAAAAVTTNLSASKDTPENATASAPTDANANSTASTSEPVAENTKDDKAPVETAAAPELTTTNKI